MLGILRCYPFSMVKGLRIARRLVVFTLAAAVAAYSQTPAPPKPLSYELVSIHPHKDDDNNWYANDTDDGIIAKGITLSDLFGMAYGYGVGPISDQLISGAPAWFNTQRFDMEAKVDVDDIPAFKKATDVSMTETIEALKNRTPTAGMRMMQELLAEHFQLKVHQTRKELPVYALVLAKGGPKLTTSADPKHGNLNFGNGKLDATGVPMIFILGILSPQLGRPVLDQTGLKDTYDFNLKWTPDADAGNDAGKSDAPPGLFTAIQEQLGLKLEPSKGLVDTFVIDHAEMPGAN